jgi:predicted ATP-grasp superfamily ATP-dependent carboligase
MLQLPSAPPVFVLNVYYSGMGIARNLRGRGVAVYGLSSEADAPGMKSRFFDAIYTVPNGRDDPDQLCGRLIEIRSNHKQSPVIFPTRDFDVLFLNEYREQLGGLYRLPEDRAVKSILDKLGLANIAARQGIAVPVTLACHTIDEIKRVSSEIGFPLVMKPRFAYQWRIGGAWQIVGARKAILVQSAEQLLDEYSAVASVNREVLLQEYISGEETDIVVCCCYIGRKGELLAYFTARKLRQNPPLFGTGCALEAADIPEIVPLAARLLKSCGHSGLAEVEFKHDKANDTFYLIEVNPRHWDQHELGTLVGVNLTWVAYSDMVGNTTALQAPIYGDRKCKWIAEPEALMLIARKTYFDGRASRRRSGLRLVSGLLAYVTALRKAVSEGIFLLRGRKVFATFDRHDPLPGFVLCLRGARDILNILRRRRVCQH